MNDAAPARFLAILFGGFLLNEALDWVVSVSPPFVPAIQGEFMSFTSLYLSVAAALAVIGLLFVRPAQWHRSFLGRATDAQAVNTLRRGDVRRIGFLLAGSVALLAGMRHLAILIFSPETGAWFPIFTDPGFDLPYWKWELIRLASYAGFALLVFVGPLRLQRLARGLRPGAAPMDDELVGVRDLSRIAYLGLACWLGARALTLGSWLAWGQLPGGDAPTLPTAALLLAVLGFACFLVHLALRGASWQHPACVIGAELGALAVAYHLVPSAQSLWVAGFVEGAWPFATTLAPHGAVAFFVAVVACLSVFSWAHRCRLSRPARIAPPEADVFS